MKRNHLKRTYHIRRAGKRWRVIELTRLWPRAILEITLTYTKSKLQGEIFLNDFITRKTGV